MTADDIPEVLRIADAVHADMPESAEVFAERLALFPDGCLMTDGGYAVAHPVRLGAPPPLDTLLGALPPDAGALHVHDVALLPHLQGQGLGAAALARFIQVAGQHGLPALSLVAVHGTPDYWRRFGFRPAAGADVRSYGADAVYMVRTV